MRYNLLFLLIFLATSFGCSDESTPDKCIDVTCDFGVCERETGECVNPASCAEASECLPQHACTENTCVFAPCEGVECAAGVCSQETGECVNKTTCTEETQAQDCLEGFSCDTQFCKADEVICADIPCERGLCNARSKACENREMCASDTDCVSGFYCDDASACAPNLCDTQTVTCERGVCEPATGNCINPTTCAASTECTDGFSCIDATCVVMGEECGPDGCAGNQVCTLDEAALTATCQENTSGCQTSIDCLNDRICRDRTCQTDVTCTADSFEPNDQTATDFRASAFNAQLSASLCAGDVDLYTYDTRDSELFTGTLLATLNFHREDVGLGSLNLELVDSQNTVVAQAQTDAAGFARVEFAVTAVKRGIYTLRVSDVDVRTAGVRYKLFMDLVDPVSVSACAAATPLVSGESVSSASTSGSSFQLGSSCTSPTNPAAEDVYSFTLTEPNYVSLDIVPQDGASLSFAVRQQCEVALDELACQSPAGSASMSFKKVLEPGTYFVVVQGALGFPGGAYSLTYTASETTCSDADNQCVGANLDFTYYCNPQGTGFLTAQCPNGCDPTTGNCNRRATDTCSTAVDASAGYTGTIAWSVLTNDYDPGQGGCVPDATGTQTNGPDAAYRVDVPANSRVRASLTRATGDFVSLYILTDCGDATSCVAGANAEPFANEVVFWTNTSDTEQTVYVIADIEQDITYSTSQITIDVAPVVCTPAVDVCVGNTLESCSDDGTVKTTSVCSFGCVADACTPAPNDLCAGALDLATGPHTATIDEYVNNYSGSCTGRPTAGKDATFTFTPPAGQVATVNVQATFDASVYVLKDCAAASTCTAGKDLPNQNNETVQWLADGSTYFVVVDASSTSATGTFTVSASAQAPTCTPGEELGCTDADTLSFCSTLGVPADYTCTDGCFEGTCGTPTGKLCADAIALSNGFTETRAFSGGNVVNPGSGQQGTCNFPASEEPLGVDTIYVADLRAGEYLIANYTSSSSYTMMYLLGDCSSGSSCLQATPDGTTGTLTYQASQDEQVFLVMDRSLAGSSTLTYTLNVQIKAPNCTPGAAPLCADATTLQYCDDLGFTQSFTCPTGGCAGNGCVQPSGNICGDPILLTAGTPVSGTLNRANAVNAIELNGPQEGSCRFDDVIQTSGNDTLYAIDLAPGDILRAQLATTSTSAFMAILDDCSADTCLAAPVTSGAGELSIHSATGGRYFIVVDATSSSALAVGYGLLATVTPGGVCTPNGSTCDPSTGTLTRCDETGFQSTTYACSFGCDGNACAIDPGADFCATAPNLGAGAVINGSYADLASDITLPNTTCAGSTASGPDAVYAVSLQGGDILHAKLRSLGQESPSLYVLTDCTDATSCVAGAPAINYTSELYYAATTTQTVYLVADSTSPLNDEAFVLDFEVLPPECTPGQRQCAPDGQTLQLCNQYGLFESYLCDGTCSVDACDNPRADTCLDPVVLTDGAVYTGSFSRLTNKLDPGVDSCIIYDPRRLDGPDGVFAVDLQAGDRLDATLNTSSSVAAMYILDSCDNPAANCRIATTYGVDTLSFVADNTQRYYLVVDSEYTISTDFTVSAQITPGQTCVPNGAICQGGVLSVCNRTGTSVAGTQTCANGCANEQACAGPTATNDTCATAEIITASTTLVDTFNRYADDINPGQACAQLDAAGPDGVYQITIPAGNVLTATLRSADSFISPTIYLLSDCANPAAACLAGEGVNYDSVVSLTYAATAEITAFLVVDTDWDWDDSPFYLDIRLQAPECTPGEKSCVGNDLLTCNTYGLYDTEPCYFGCSNNACNPTPNDTCAGAIDVSLGGLFTAPASVYLNDYNPMVNNVSCTGDDALGRDAVYMMSLEAGDFVELNLTGPTDPVLYVSTTCGDNNTVALGCIAGADDTNTPENLSFVAPSTGTYYIFADLDTNLSNSNFALDVKRQTAGLCTPNTRTCTTADTAQFCDDSGTRLVDITCLNGCNNGYCGQPRGDSCADPIRATGGGLFTIDMAGLSNDYDLTNTSCIGSASPANDAVFQVDLQAGEALDALVTSTTGHNPAVYLVQDCAGIRDQANDHACIDGANISGTTESLTYVASAPETVYLVVDSSSTFANTASYTVDLYVGQGCTVGTSYCADANTLSYCPTGSRENLYTCDGGCTNGACNTPSGDICADPLVVTSGTYQGTYSGTDALNLGTGTNGGCLFESSEDQTGVDYTYAVDLLAGQRLDASFSSNSSFAIMYLTSDCNAGNACISTTRDGSSGALSHVAAQDERVYIVMDRTLSGSDSFYTYALTVQVQ